MGKLNTKHEKTDTKICQLLHHALQMNNGQETVCIVHSGDVDIVVILLASEAKNLHVFIDNGRGKYMERYLYYGSKRFLHFQGMITSPPPLKWKASKKHSQSWYCVSGNLLLGLEKFVCILYGKKRLMLAR